MNNEFNDLFEELPNNECIKKGLSGELSYNECVDFVGGMIRWAIAGVKGKSAKTKKIAKEILTSETVINWCEMIGSSMDKILSLAGINKKDLT